MWLLFEKSTQRFLWALLTVANFTLFKKIDNVRETTTTSFSQKQPVFWQTINIAIKIWIGREKNWKCMIREKFLFSRIISQVHWVACPWNFLMLHTQCWNEMRSKCKYNHWCFCDGNREKLLKIEFCNRLSEAQIFAICRRMYSRRTHYDVLRLKKNCSSDEVRQSFTKLSKMVNIHPARFDVKCINWW